MTTNHIPQQKRKLGFRSNRMRLFLQGVSSMLPMAASALVDGMVFGALSRQAGVSLWVTLLFSLFVNAGSSQYAALGFFTQGVTGWPVLLSTLFINARHSLYGLTLGPAFQGKSWWKLVFMATQLSDESYAVAATSLANRQQASLSYFFGAGYTDYAGWLGGTLLGGIFGSLIAQPSAYGLDFAFIATFLGFLAIQLQSRYAVKVAIVSSGLACVGYWLGGTTVATIVGTVGAMVMGGLARE